MKSEIKRSWFFKQSKEEVWDYLTKAELIEKWLMPNDFQLKIEHEFTFTNNPIPSLDLNGIFYCKVLEFEVCKKLVYTWQGGMSKENPVLSTTVEWTLEPVEGGTQLHLNHTGFQPENESILDAMYGGWDEHVQKIIANLKSV